MPFYSQRYLRQNPQLQTTHLSLGWHPKTRDELLIPDSDRYAGMYVIGVQGVGKSGFLETVAYQDAAAGRGMIVIDPHGDLIRNILAQLPQHRIAQTFVLDVEDEAFPFMVNLFSTRELRSDLARSQAVERIMHVFETLWEDVLSQQNLPRYVRAATITFLDNPGASLVDMLTFFQDEAFRGKMIANVKDPTVRQFWATQFSDTMSEAEKQRRVGPLVNRLESLFMGRSLVRNIVGARSSLDFRRAIEERHILLVKLPVKTVAQDARLIGTILLAQFSAAVFSFADTPVQERPDTTLIVDEGQNFATSDFSALFAEGRKFHVKTIFAHQWRGQLPGFLQDSTMSARTKVVFQVTPEDTNKLAHFFPVSNSGVAPTDLDPHPTKHLIDYGCDDPLTRTFIELYLRPADRQSTGKRVEMLSERRVGAFDIVLGAVGENGEKKPVYEADPIPYLDTLFYEAMRTGNPWATIPKEAVLGLANGGGGFYGATRWATADVLKGDATYPAHLVNHTVSGYVWLRKPESERERMHHCIFHLRMALMYLAAHPISKTSKSGKPSASESAQMLVHLPRRAAFVKAGEDVGVIYTHKTPQQLAGQALEARLYFVREQSRQRYCHPREQIEELIDSTTPPDEFTLSRWEAVESDDGTSSQSSERSAAAH